MKNSFKKSKDVGTKRYKISWLMDILLIIEIIISVSCLGVFLAKTNNQVKTNTDDILTINGKVEKIERQLTKLDGKITNITDEKITVNGVERSVVNTVKAIAGFLGDTQIKVVEVDGSYYSVDTSLISNVQSLSARINTVENSCSVLTENYVDVNGKVVRVENELQSYKNGTNEQLQATVNSLKDDLQAYAESLEVSVVDNELRSFIFSDNDFEYSLSGGNSLKCSKLKAPNVSGNINLNTYTVPSEIMGFPVIGFSNKCFSSCQYDFRLNVSSGYSGNSILVGSSHLVSLDFYGVNCNISSSSFYQCTNLKTVTIHSCSSISNDAFVNNRSLERLYIPHQFEGTTFTFASGVSPTIYYI